MTRKQIAELESSIVRKVLIKVGLLTKGTSTRPKKSSERVNEIKKELRIKEIFNQIKP